jgi:hypothetical protein
MAGQVVESYRRSRGMMENAAYAVHIHRDAALALVWLDRHKNEAVMKARIMPLPGRVSSSRREFPKNFLKLNRCRNQRYESGPMRRNRKCFEEV